MPYGAFVRISFKNKDEGKNFVFYFANLYKFAVFYSLFNAVVVGVHNIIISAFLQTDTLKQPANVPTDLFSRPNPKDNRRKR